MVGLGALPPSGGNAYAHSAPSGVSARSLYRTCVTFARSEDRARPWNPPGSRPRTTHASS